MSQDGHPSLARAHERALAGVVGFAHDYPAGWATEMHQHPRAQLLYASAGVMRIETERARFVVPPGLGLFMPPGHRHLVRMDGPVAMRALFLREEAAGSCPRHVAVLAISPLLRELILAACAHPPEAAETARSGLVAALAVDEIGRAAPLSLGLPSAADARVRRIMDRLQAHPADPLTLPALGGLAGASPRTAARLFRAETGMSFGQWRRQLRLTEAVVALAAGQSLAAAAASAGYRSGPAFGAAFRAAFGTSPGTLRRRGTNPGAGGTLSLLNRDTEASMAESGKDETPKATGTTGAPNPKSGSSDAARGLGGHSKDASHKEGAPAQYVEEGKPKAP